MKPKSKVNFSDPTIIGVLAGLKQAAQNARQLSEQTGTPFYVWQDGKIVDLNPQKKKRIPVKKVAASNRKRGAKS